MEVPTHVAFIMDGNGRWAAARGLPRSEGHRQGATTATEIVREARNLGIKYVTMYAFSSENFFRPREEVNFLMKLFETFLKKYTRRIVKDGTRFRAIGDLSKFPQSLQKAIQDLQEKSKAFDKFHLTIALNYGARDEITQAVKKILQGGTATETITWDFVKQHLYTADLPDPDLVIRTSGEQRLSNFLLLQSAYAELFFTKTFWPDFDEKELALAIGDYQQRDRRMGRT